MPTTGVGVEVLTTSHDWLDNPKFPWMKLKYTRLNPIQGAVLPYATEDCNLVVAAATSAGKTVVAELCMAPVVRPKVGKDRANRKDGSIGKAIYLAPLKALAQEKMDDWTDPLHPFSKLNLVIATGDTMFGSQRQRILKQCHEADILCMTSEMLDSMTRRMQSEQNNWLNEVRAVVVDESHLLAMEERGDKLESALMRFTAQNGKARLILLSATMPNVGQIGEWVNKLNGKRTVVIQSDWRPVKLDVHYDPYPAQGGWKFYHDNRRNMMDAVMELVGKYQKHRVLVFVHSKNDGYELQRDLQAIGTGAEFHNADVDKEGRRRIESAFRDKGSDLRVIIATSTLAYGLNLPARVVIIAGTKRGISPVHPYDIRQEIGRSGRYGIDDKGDAHVLVAQNEYQNERARLEALPPISSQLEIRDTLMFHVVAEIAEGYHTNVADLYDGWYLRSLAATRGRQLSHDAFFGVMADLLDNGLIRAKADKDNPNTAEVEATGLGKVASWLYYHPLDVAGWYKNFRQLVERGKTSDLAISWALAHVHTQCRVPYIPKALQDVAEQYKREINDAYRLPCGNEAVAGYGYLLALRHGDSEIPKGWGMEVRQVRYEAERLMQAIALIDTHHGRWHLGEKWKLLGLRMQYGVEEGLVELVANLEGVGAVRAQRLKKAGYGTIKEIAAAGAFKLGKVLGKALGASVWAQAEQSQGRNKA